MVQFASYLRRVLRKTRLIFPRINGPNVTLSRFFFVFFFNNPTPTTYETLGVLTPASRTAKLAWALLPFPLKGKKEIYMLIETA